MAEQRAEQEVGTASSSHRGGRGRHMTTPQDSPQVFEGTDISVDPKDLDVQDTPATSDPEQLTDDGKLGGAGGQGGAG